MNHEVLNQTMQFEFGKEEIRTGNCLLKLRCKEERNFDGEEEVKSIPSHLYKFVSLNIETLNLRLKFLKEF
jgi:hypothetical protein